MPREADRAAFATTLNCAVRIVGGAAWFRAADVCRRLGYKNCSQAVNKHVRPGHKLPLSELDAGSCSGTDPPNSTYIDLEGVKALLFNTRLPQADRMVEELGLEQQMRYLPKETELVQFFQELLTQLCVSFEFQKHVAGFRIDLYLPEQKLAIEIDEYGHTGYDAAAECWRTEQVKKILGCTFLRFNPDHPNFRLASCVALLVAALYPKEFGSCRELPWASWM